MSLHIDPAKVVGVLLADGWHDVADASFTLDSYEYVEDDLVLHGGGQSGVCAAGFAFTEASVPGPSFDGRRLIAGPLTAVLAVERVS